MPDAEQPQTVLEILVIGDELLDGRTHESNSHYLASQCRLRGVTLRRVTFINDEPSVVRDALLEAVRRSPLVVTSGGLGPTLDDRTRYAIAEAAGVGLRTDRDVRERLAQKYQSRGRVMNEANLRQAQFPETAAVLPSAVGTADAFEIRIGESMVVCLPGIPHEFRDLVERYVLDRHTNTRPRGYRRFHLFGRGESSFAEKIEKLQIPSCVKITYNAHFPVVDIELSSADGSTVLDDVARRLERDLSPWIFESETRSPARELVGLLEARGWTLGLAESCTGGWLANAVTDVAGVSAQFQRSFVTYSNAAKIELLGVSAETLSAHGAVSVQTAREMAEGTLAACHAELAVALTGIAGPSGGSDDKPVGTVYIGVATREQTVVAHALFQDLSRARFKAVAGTAATMIAIRLLQGRLSEIDSFLGIQSYQSFPSDSSATTSV